ncbi:ABC transporter ATP-binding protein [Variovorax sp. dw_954]|uniref:ABC transporter ATP-binding protein n=1 Tax=Variovorax sp. dw_954 TaxID=2720078 RepID=UPI001BD6D457|nr:ABC transporter ATP-binding protein [Variovorax sp. dw_954]
MSAAIPVADSVADPAAVPAAAPLLQVRDLHGGYGRVSVLEGVSIEVPERGLVAIVGSNGAGKSTLLRALSGLVRSSSGEIVFGGQSLVGAAPGAIVAQGLLHVAEGRRLFRSQTVRDNLQLGLWGAKLGKADAAARFDRVFTLFPVLHERQGVRAGILSGGQQQMLAVAQALMHAPRLLMLDEPSLGLAPAVIDQLLDAVVQLRTEGTTILLVEQMVERALQIADTAYVLQNGRVIGHGPARELHDSELVRQAYLGAGATRAPSPSTPSTKVSA